MPETDPLLALAARNVHDLGRDGPPGDCYEIVLGRKLGGRSAAMFAGLEIVEIPGDGMLLRGVFADQAALHGMLARIRDLGVPLLAVRVIAPSEETTGSRP